MMKHKLVGHLDGAESFPKKIRTIFDQQTKGTPSFHNVKRIRRCFKVWCFTILNNFIENWLINNVLWHHLND